MNKEGNATSAGQIMLDFAAETGLSKPAKEPRRYLWTDAFAVCNFLELYHGSRDQNWLVLAKQLVDQVHQTLGRRRPESGDGGWLSGLSEEEGERHPTRGGLRIGKKLEERTPDEPVDERLEWERDGQYYHYLTKWMHALNGMARMTEEPRYLRWAIELAQTTHRAFRFGPTSDAPAGLHWKMSIDLTRPLVRSVGQHDPLDGLVTYSELQQAARRFGNEPFPDLQREIGELAAMCRGRDWTTEDGLGIGGVLCDACQSAELIVRNGFSDLTLFRQVVNDALLSLEDLGGGFLDQPARRRLAFRELGLSIGLKAVARLAALSEEYPEVLDGEPTSWLRQRLEALLWFRKMSERIESFWIRERKKGSEHWRSHGDINTVMLATSLAPGEFLKV